jgi:hypothetical protein
VKKNEVRQAIYGYLGSVLGTVGFRIIKSEERFLKRMAGGAFAIGVPLIDYNPEFIFSLVMVIRLDIVERIYYRFVEVDPKYHSQGATVITRLSYFVKDVPGRYRRFGPAEYKVQTEEDIAGAMSHLLPVVQASILPFFEKHRTVADLHAAVNQSDPGIDASQRLDGAMHSMILARLADSPDFERIVTRHCHDLLGQLLPEDKNRLDRLIAYLREHSPVALAEGR